MTWRRFRLDERDQVAGNYVALVRPLSALRSLLSAEAGSVNEHWSLLNASLCFLDDGIRAGLTVDDVSFTARVLPPELLLNVIRLIRATEPIGTTWQSARATVHRVGYIKVDFYPHGRAYRIADWLHLANPGRRRAFEQLAAGRLRL